MTSNISTPINKRLSSGTSSPVLMWSSSGGTRRKRWFSSCTISPAAKPAMKVPQKPLEIQLSWVAVVVPICAR